MAMTLLVVGAAFVLSWIPAFVVYLVVRRRFSGDRVITCPENGEAQAVRIDAGHAAATSLGGPPDLRLEWCSRWPEKKDCGQQCLSQIAESPDGCLVRARLESWYSGARCCLCGEGFGRIQWFDRKPGLRGPDGRAVSWDEVPGERLNAILSTYRPLCFNCLVAETFRSRFPDRVVEDPLRPGAAGRRGPRSAA